MMSDKTQFKFPNQLSKEDRQKIHLIAKDKGIKSQSQGSKFRCLYIFKNELLIQSRANHLIAAELQQLTAPNISHFENVQDVIDAAVSTASQPFIGPKRKKYKIPTISIVGRMILTFGSLIGFIFLLTNLIYNMFVK